MRAFESAKTSQAASKRGPFPDWHRWTSTGTFGLSQGQETSDQAFHRALHKSLGSQSRA